MDPALFPDFYFVGAPKAATTSIFHYLGQHPDLFLPEIKEPHYFSCPEVKETYYQVTFIDDTEQYLALYNEGTNRLRGDCSTSYLFSIEAARRIRNCRPDAKIFMILRNPIDRAISHYLMDMRFGLIDIPLINILNDPSRYPLYFKEYVEGSLYADQVNRYLAAFPSDQINIILYEEISADPSSVLKGIFKSMGVSQNVSLSFNRANEHRVYRNQALRRITKSTFLRSLARRIPPPMKEWTQAMLTTRRKPPLDLERDRLSELLQDDMNRLALTINRDLSRWSHGTIKESVTSRHHVFSEPQSL